MRNIQSNSVELVVCRFDFNREHRGLGMIGDGVAVKEADFVWSFYLELTMPAISKS